MATWIVGGVVVLIVGAIVWKMIRDKRNGTRRLRRRLCPLPWLVRQQPK